MKILNSYKSVLSFKQISLTQLLFVVVLLVGLYLRFYQHLMGRSIWEDESHFALNFMRKGFLELLQPLELAQAGPILFLWGVKLCGVLFGYGEIALRTFPFMLSIISLPLVYFVFLELSHNKVTALIGFFLFSINVTLIHFASEIKPYTIDVSIYVILAFITVSSNQFIQTKRTLLLILLGCFGILVSNVAFLILFCVSICLMIDCFYDTKKIKQTALIFAAWLITFGFNYLAFIHNHPTGDFMRQYWAFAFCPTNILSCEFITFLNSSINEIFYTRLLYISHRYYFGYFVLLFVVMALKHLISKKSYTTLSLICLPILLHLILSALRQYPFAHRFILYLIPSFIYLISLGVSLTFDFAKAQAGRFVSLLLVLFPIYLLAIESINTFPLWYREIKPAIDFVNKQPKQMHLYMSEPIHAYTYYRERKYAQLPVFEQIPWEPDYSEILSIVDKEQGNCMIFYIPHKYNTTIEMLRKNKRLVDIFEFKNYGVAIIKPTGVYYGKLIKSLNYTDFNVQQPFGENKAIPIWGGSVKSNKIYLESGKYTLRVESWGTPLNGIYPSNSILLNNKKVTTFKSPQKITNQTLHLSIAQSGEYELSINLDNDLSNENEDRNTFVKSITIYKN